MTLAELEAWFRKSHDSLAFHMNQLSAENVALRERISALERRRIPWWRRLFERTQ